jgi:hypothetical protein
LTCEHETRWAKTDLRKNDWDERWKEYATGNALLNVGLVIFVGFKTALPYLVSTLEHTQGPQCFMVGKSSFDCFEAADGTGFAGAFGITRDSYVEATAKSFLGDLLERVYSSLLGRQMSVDIPRQLAARGLDRDQLIKVLPDPEAMLQGCNAQQYQRFLRRATLWTNTYVPVQSNQGLDVLRLVLLLALAYPIRLAAHRNEGIRVIDRGPSQTRVFCASGGQDYPLCRLRSPPGWNSARTMHP